MAVKNIENIAFDDVNKLLKEDLGLEKNSPDIHLDALLTNIVGVDGAKIEAIDVLAIFHRFVTNANEYFTGERFTEKGKKMILYALKEQGSNELFKEVQEKPVISVDEAMKYLTPRLLANASIWAYMRKDKTS